MAFCAFRLVKCGHDSRVSVSMKQVQDASKHGLASIREPVEKFPAGEEWPFGATWIESEKAFNFALFSRYAIRVTLLCYRQDDVVNPAFTFEFQHPAHK